MWGKYVALKCQAEAVPDYQDSTVYILEKQNICMCVCVRMCVMCDYNIHNVISANKSALQIL